MASWFFASWIEFNGVPWCSVMLIGPNSAPLNSQASQSSESCKLDVFNRVGFGAGNAGIMMFRKGVRGC